jgi:ceramide synthetase
MAASATSSDKRKSTYDDDLAIKPVNPVLDHVLGLIFILLALRLLYEFYFDFELGVLFFVALAISYVWVQCVRKGALKVAMFISDRRVGPSIPIECQRPLASELAQRKVMDQSWQLAIHVTMTAFAFYLMKDTTWFTDTASTFSPCPSRFREGELSRPMQLNAYYVMQLAIWMWTAFSCKWLESRRKDYVEMMLHHIVTIMLVLASLLYKEHPMGMLVLIVHDSSDVVLDMMKLANYFKLENSHGFFITEFCFFLNTFVSWPLLRLYYFPKKVIYEGVIVGESIGLYDRNLFCKVLNFLYYLFRVRRSLWSW